MAPAKAPSAGSVLIALLMRDVIVVRRELAFFLMRTAMQPLMFTVVFGYLLPRMGFMHREYTAALLPGTTLGLSAQVIRPCQAAAIHALFASGDLPADMAQQVLFTIEMRVVGRVSSGSEIAGTAWGRWSAVIRSMSASRAVVIAAASSAASPSTSSALSSRHARSESRTVVMPQVASCAS